MDSAPFPSASPATPLERAAIDASLRRPLLILIGSALAWLLAADALHLLFSVQAYAPGFCADAAWLSYGRVEAASRAAELFGWAALGGYVVVLWLMARLCGAALGRWGGEAVAGTAWLWNLVLLAGIATLLRGGSIGVGGLELPPRVMGVLIALQGVLAVVVLSFWLRRRAYFHISQWYLLGAAFWFPCLCALAEWNRVAAPVPGPVQAMAGAWFSGAVFGLWLLPVGLAAIYYLVPKLMGRPIESGVMARIGFWALALAAGFVGAAQLAGGATAPAWVGSVGIGARIVLAIPVLAAAFNLYPLLGGRIGKLALAASPVLRCAIFALTAFILLYVEEVLTGFRSTGAVVRFTYWEAARSGLGLQGFYAFALFGAFYYIAPRMAGWEWPSLRLMRLHFWGSALGVVMLVKAMAIGGLLQGLGLMDPRIPFATIVSTTLPFLWLRAGAWLVLLAAHGSLAILFVQLLFRVGPLRSGPTLFPADSTRAALTSPS